MIPFSNLEEIFGKNRELKKYDMMNKPRILFVDDERNILDGLRRMLRRKRFEWDLDFANSGAEGLGFIDSTMYDVVVSDMRMPEMDGAEFLARVMKKSPETIRFILSGHSNKDAIFRSLNCTHQFINKPCDSSILIELLNRALCVKQQVKNEPIRRLISEIDTLPSLPNTYQKIRYLSQSEAGVRETADIIAADVAMSAKVLYLVNSAFFGLSREVSDVYQAASLLGMETLQSLVLSAGVFDKFPEHALCANFSLNRFIEHSSACGALAKQITLEQTEDETMAQHSMTAGLLHDVGKLIMASKLPEVFQDTLDTSQEDEKPLFEVEVECEGFTHAEVGAYLLDLWHLPLSVLDAVAFHHFPDKTANEIFTPTIAVHIANILSQERDPGCSGNSIVPKLNMELLQRLGLDHRIDQWRQIELTPVIVT